MNHFTKKYFQGIAGAGKPKKPDPPPPPVLNPPKLGDLQAISTFEYVESIDLISDGSIDGLISQNGTYLEDNRIFESIYLNDVPIKQSTNITGNVKGTDIFDVYPIDGIGKQLSGICYKNNEFIETSVDYAVQNFSGTILFTGTYTGSNRLGALNGSVSWQLIDGKNNIANDIYQSITEIGTETDIEQVDDERQAKILGDYLRQLKNGRFNFKSPLEVSTFLLEDLPNKFVDEYPFVCLKLNFEIDTSANTELSPEQTSYVFDINDFLYLDSDIHNQIYLPLEVTEINKRRFLESKRKINLTYPAGNGFIGNMYLFLYKEDGKLLKNSIDAVIKHIKYAKIASPFSKYNISNANCEIRNGTELQRPMSLFQKSYADTQYSFKLIGPFGKGLNTARLKQYGIGIDASVFPETLQGDGLTIGLISSVDFLSNTDYENAIKYNSFLDLRKSPSKAVKSKQTRLYANNSDAYIRLTSVTQRSGTNIYDFKWRLGVKNTVQKVKDGGWKCTSNNRSWIAFFYLSFDASTLKFTNLTGQTLPNGSPAQCRIEQSRYWTKGDGTIVTKVNTNFNFLKNINEYAIASNMIDGATYITEAISPPFIYFDSNSRIAPRGSMPATIIIQLAAASLSIMRGTEGSDDQRTSGGVQKYYDEWNKAYIAYNNESARPLVHIIDNPNVDSLFITMGLRVLKDTAQNANTPLAKYNPATNSAGGTASEQLVEIGATIPSIIKFKIECGYQDKNGDEIIHEGYPRFYEITGIADSPCTIDIGRQENANSLTAFNRFILGGSHNIATPIDLPPAIQDKIRFFRVTRETYESYSSLIKREIYLDKVSEIVNLPFSYPYSSICGLKLDARSSSEIPARSYDARFKKVFVPSNYFPLHPDGRDKRNLTINEFNSASLSDKIIYEGNWDGTFKFAWTDNPVWVLFDILTNRRYGLGNFVEPTQINYWELYKIGRYCDAVDNNGVFVGIQTQDGYYEPRYSFNGVIADKTNVFDILKTIVATFRGNMFYSNSEINFTNDMLKPIMSFFNNANVKDGIFSYTNDRRDLQYNVVEVSFLDKTDLYKEKIEYIEDPDDIKNRGILRTSASTFGVTSRAHAKRIGQHIIYSTINEDQNVTFTAGLETLLCRPGDLISINDELKSFKRNVGRVLNVDLGQNSIYTNITLTSSDFTPSGVMGQLNVLIPSGKISQQEFYDLSKSPTKLNINSLYANDTPMSVVLDASSTGLNDYGSTFFINPKCSGISLLKDIKIGAPCSITLANTQQEIYKIQSIKETNLNEYEVVATKFDTGKFAEIESGQFISDFYQYFPASRTGSVNEGNSAITNNAFQYQLSYPQITSFSTGDYDLQNDVVDFFGSWNEVDNANCYDVELITPRYRSIKYRITDTNITFTDQSEVGQFTLKVTARTTGIYPNPISPTSTAGFKVISYTAPIRNNGIVKTFKINN